MVGLRIAFGAADVTLQTRQGLEIKRATVTAAGVFAGLASTFGKPADRLGDVVAPGAFSASLSEHKAAGTMPALLWAHEPAEPVGKWTSLTETSTGLQAEGQLTLELARAKDAHALMRDGALSLSIGYRTRKSNYREGSRILEDLDLVEISLVAMPANPRAKITTVKGAIQGPGDLEAALREIGFSSREAKRIVAGGWKAYARDDASNELTEAAAMLAAHTELLRTKI